MSYFVVCTFDLKNGSYDDYQNAYADLAKIGFNRQVKSAQGILITLPTTTTAGEFNGTSSGLVRDDLTERVKRAFEARRFKSEIFVSVGGDWAWGHRTT
ncbi:MAG: hypothetical protein WA094_15520 [Candidatus Desulfobacillus denitrificans]